MGPVPLPNLLRRWAPAALALAAAGCGATWDGTAEFFGASRPGLHVRRLDALHDPKTFRHRPDEPATFEECLEEVLVLADEEYDEPGDAAGAVFLLARVATEDSAALHRAQACRGLGRLGALLTGSADPPAGPPPTEGEAAAALARLREIHAAGHGSDAEVIECAALFRRLGDFRVPLLADPGPSGYGRDLRILRGTLLGVLAESRSESGTPGEGESERALRLLGLQVVRTALAGSTLHDGDPRVRAEAALAAGSFGGADMAAVLRTAYLAEVQIPARRAIAEAAAAVAARLETAARGPSVVLLLTALDDDDRGIRFEAREGLSALAGEDLGGKPGPWQRWWAGEQVRP